VDGNSKWTIRSAQYKELELAQGQFARIHLADNKADGELLLDGNRQIIRSVSKVKARSPSGDLYVHTCKAGTEDSKDELTAACKNFQESVKFEPGADD
jgi:hypothetical protein